MPTIVNCPTCGAEVEWTEKSRYRPFCSERCQQIDLGAWAEEKYTIPGGPPDAPLADPDADPAQ